MSIYLVIELRNVRSWNKIIGSNLFFNYCKWNNISYVEQTLSKQSDIDLMYDDGNCFFFAVQNNNPKMLELLINYYLRDVNDIPEERTQEENMRVHCLKEVINDIEQKIDIPESIKEIIKPYSYVTSYDISDDEIDDLADYDTKAEDVDIDFIQDEFVVTATEEARMAGDSWALCDGE